MPRETHSAPSAEDAAPRLAPRILARCLLALLPAALAWVALESLATGLVRPAEALELGFLARLAAAVLTTAGLLAGSRRQLVGVSAGALAVVATAWLTPPGLPRGAAVVALLAAVLAGSAVVGLAEARERQRRHGDPVDGLPRLPRLPVAGTLIALAVGLQLLVRSPLLLTPGLAPSFDPDLAARLPLWLAVRLELFGLPILGALAVSALAARRGLAAALTAGAAAVLLGGGWTREGVVCLGVLSVVPRPEERAQLVGPAGRRRLAVLVLPALVAVAVVGLALVWTRLAAFALLAGLGLALADRPRPGAKLGGRLRLAGLVAVAGLALGAALVAGIAPWPDAVSRAALVPLAVPLLGLGLVDGDRRQAALGLAALALAVAGARTVPGTAALAAPAALAACAAFGRTSQAKAQTTPGRPGTAFQAAWSELALVAVVVAAAYPWRRADPFGLLIPDAAAVRWELAVAVAALAGGVVVVLRSRPRSDALRAAAAVALVAGALGLALRIPASGTVILGPGGAPALTATGADSSAAVTLVASRLDPPRSVHEVVVDSFLANAADLSPGTPVATLHLTLAGAPDRTWTLRTGEDTGEWAASRGDLAPAGLTTPAPWASWVAPDTSVVDGATGDPSSPRGFFGQLYRSRTRVDLGDGASVTEVRLTRRPDLPADTAFAVRRLELF